MARRFTQVSQVFVNIANPLTPVRSEEMSQKRWRSMASLAANLFGGGMSAPLAIAGKGASARTARQLVMRLAG